MKILIAYPHLNVFGGGERLTSILTYELEKQGNEILIVTAMKSDLWFKETTRVKFKYIKRMREEAQKLPQLIKQRLTEIWEALIEAIEEFQPDILLTMIQEPIYNLLAKIVEPKLKTAIYIHFPREEEVTKENLKIFINMYRFPLLYEQFYNICDIRMVNSHYTNRALYKMFGIKAHVVYPAIPWEFYETEINLAEKRENIILYVARFVPQKRILELIEWFKNKIKPEVKDAKLLLIGVKDPRHEEYHKKIMEEAAREDIEVIDKPLPTREIIKQYQRAKIYIHPRYGEHFGMAPAEAMTQGAIPILPEKSGLAELLTHGRDGYLAKNDQEFIKYTIKLLKMPHEEIVKMRKYIQMKIQMFNPDRFAKEVYLHLKLALTK